VGEVVGPLVPGGVLAFDAGNSKTDVALVSADGTVLGTARGGGFEPHIIGAFAAVDGLAPLVAAAAAEAGLTVGEVPLVQQISACLANADLPIEEERLAEAFESHGWASSVHVANDTFALLRAGVDEPRGVAVVCGAGINCAGLLPDGRTARFPAVGKISGDWGGGQQLADEAFWAAARADDGRGPATALATVLPAHYGVASMPLLIEAFHLGEIPATRRLEATPLLFQVASTGDAVATAVVQRQAEEIVAMAVVAPPGSLAGTNGRSTGRRRADRRPPPADGNRGAPTSRIRPQGHPPRGRRPPSCRRRPTRSRPNQRPTHRPPRPESRLRHTPSRIAPRPGPLSGARLFSGLGLIAV
jgi:N-acetylglucosamine kinase-like BadF-type ATPase